MKKKRYIKSQNRSNFYCKVVGYSDRLFRLVDLNNEGIALSGFLRKRTEIFNMKTAAAIESAQSAVMEARKKAERIISQIREYNEDLNNSEMDHIRDFRRRKRMSVMINELVSLRHEIKSVYVILHDELSEIQSQIRRQTTAYLLAAFSRKSSIDISSHEAAINYETMIAYKTYLKTYSGVDDSINYMVESFTANNDLDSRGKEMI